MGMYTGFRLDVLLKPDMPPPALAALIRAIEQAENMSISSAWAWPDHPAFKCDQIIHGTIFCCTSAYLGESPWQGGTKLIPYNEGWHLTIGVSIKNYENEIEKFLDWLMPYIDVVQRKKPIGAFRYEEDEQETLIWVKS